MARSFPICYFFECCSEWIEVHFIFRPSSSPCNFFSMSCNHVMISKFPYFALKLFCFSRIRLRVCLRNFLQLAGIIFFRCFVMSYFAYIAWSYLGIFLVFHLSSVPSELSLWVVSFILKLLLFYFRPNIFSRFSSVLACPLVDEAFLFVFPVSFPIQVLNFSSLGEPQSFHRLISFLHRLFRLIPWCCSLRYVSIIRLLFPFPYWLFSWLDF